MQKILHAERRYINRPSTPFYTAKNKAAEALPSFQICAKSMCLKKGLIEILYKSLEFIGAGNEI